MIEDGAEGVDLDRDDSAGDAAESIPVRGGSRNRKRLPRLPAVTFVVSLPRHPLSPILAFSHHCISSIFTGRRCSALTTAASSTCWVLNASSKSGIGTTGALPPMMLQMSASWLTNPCS
jgi:hypothetical protein